jgi:8-oxo-dGTP diphosphatase
MTVTVTDRLLHQLVVGSHAEGTTNLAVAAAIEHDDRVLLIAADYNDFQPVWQLPSDLVLPGETLLYGLARTVTVTTGLGVVEVTGYVGHHDRELDGEIVRTFIFTVTAEDPERVCRWASISHR